MPTTDFVMTMDSDGEDDTSQKPSKTDDDAPHLNPEFNFDFSNDYYADILDQHKILPDLIKKGSQPVSVFTEASIRPKLIEQSGSHIG